MDLILIQKIHVAEPSGKREKSRVRFEPKECCSGTDIASRTRTNTAIGTSAIVDRASVGLKSILSHTECSCFLQVTYSWFISNTLDSWILGDLGTF